MRRYDGKNNPVLPLVWHKGEKRRLNQTNATAADVRAALENKLTHFFGVSTDEATFAQVYGAVILTVRDILSQKKILFHRRRRDSAGQKEISMLCMEFLIGPSLQNNLRNLGLEDQDTEMCSKKWIST